MAVTDDRRPSMTVDGELVTGREAFQVPVAVRTNIHHDRAVLELEAQQAAASNRIVRLSNLTVAEVRRLRDELDAVLATLEVTEE